MMSLLAFLVCWLVGFVVWNYRDQILERLTSKSTLSR